MAGVTRNPRPLFVTALPAAPSDGMEVFYRADNTNGVIWHLRARSVANGGSATYPWEFVGGGALSKKTAAAVTATTSTNTQKTGGPAVTIPLAGEYTLSYGATIINSTATYTAITPYYNGSTLSLGADNEVVNHATAYLGVSGAAYETLSTAGNQLELYYRVDGGTGTFIRRWISAIPVRVG